MRVDFALLFALKVYFNLSNFKLAMSAKSIRRAIQPHGQLRMNGISTYELNHWATLTRRGLMTDVREWK